jgi:ABC-type glycerol-3-phosphate transport system permease component
MNNQKSSLIFTRIMIYIVLAIILIITIVPVWMLLVNATRSTNEIQQGIGFFPSTHMIENYKILVGKGLDLPRGFVNSLIIAVATTLVTVYFAFLTGYGIVAYEFKGKKFFFAAILVLILIPLQLSIIGYFRFMSVIGLTDNYLSLILPSLAAPAAVFFAKQYLESIMIPDLVDAGRVDGCSELGIFHRIMMPIAMPGAFTLALFTFVASWNNFFNPYILINSRDKYTLPMLIQTLRGDVYRPEYGAIYFGLAASIVPIIIIYFLFSRFIVNGISMGAVKE